MDRIWVTFVLLTISFLYLETRRSEMLQELGQASANIGLGMNFSKTKSMSSDQNVLILVDNNMVKKVNEHNHLGHNIRPGKDQTK